LCVTGNTGNRQRLDRKVWVALGLGILSPLSTFPVQTIARRLPVVPLTKWPAVYLSVGIAFALAAAALVLVSQCVRALEARREDPLLPTALVYLGLVALMAGLVFAVVADFLKPHSALALLLPSVVLGVLGFVGFLILSPRGRRALRSEPARRLGLEAVRYIEVLAAAALIVTILMPSDYDKLKAVILLAEGTIISPLMLFVGYRLNRKSERYDSLRCRLRSYAIAVPVLVLIVLAMPSL